LYNVTLKSLADKILFSLLNCLIIINNRIIIADRSMVNDYKIKVLVQQKVNLVCCIPILDGDNVNWYYTNLKFLIKSTRVHDHLIYVLGLEHKIM